MGVAVAGPGGLSLARFGLGAGAPTADSGLETASATVTGDAEFAFRIVDVEPCGLVCRNVTGEIRNRGTTAASNVTIAVTVSANGSAVWTNSRRVGSVSVGEAYQTTERVTVSPPEAQAIQANDGAVTVTVVVRHDGGTNVIERERSVL